MLFLKNYYEFSTDRDELFRQFLWNVNWEVYYEQNLKLNGRYHYTICGLVPPKRKTQDSSFVIDRNT